MRDYELVLVLDPDLTSEKRKKLLKKIQDALAGGNGKVVKKDEWGQKQLAYPIKHKVMGYYFFWEIKLPATAIEVVDEMLKSAEGLLRYLLIRKETDKKKSKSKRDKGGEK
jgi:small subunit ribosomal protein S6